MATSQCPSCDTAKSSTLWAIAQSNILSPCMFHWQRLRVLPMEPVKKERPSAAQTQLLTGSENFSSVLRRLPVLSPVSYHFGTRRVCTMFA